MSSTLVKIPWKTSSLHPHSFPKRMLQGSACFSRLMETSSLEQREEQIPHVPQSSSMSREDSDRVGEVGLFANGYSK